MCWPRNGRRLRPWPWTKCRGAEHDLQLLYGQVSQRYSAAGAGSEQPFSRHPAFCFWSNRLGSCAHAWGRPKVPLRRAYSGVQQVYGQTNAQVKEVLWLLDQVDQASFDILAGENPVQGR
jgi:hypothetical protein